MTILLLLAFVFGYLLMAVIMDIQEQREANEFRQTVGLQKKTVRIRRN